MTARRPVLIAALLCTALLAACKDGGSAAPPGGAGAPAAGPAAGSEIEAGLAFLKAVARLNHKDEAGAAWEELARLGAAKVRITAGGQAHELDAGARKSEVRLLRFARLQSWREGATIRGVTLGEVELKVDKADLKGAGRLALQAKGDRWVATALEVDVAP